MKRCSAARAWACTFCSAIACSITTTATRCCCSAFLLAFTPCDRSFLLVRGRAAHACRASSASRPRSRAAYFRSRSRSIYLGSTVRQAARRRLAQRASVVHALRRRAASCARSHGRAAAGLADRDRDQSPGSRAWRRRRPSPASCSSRSGCGCRARAASRCGSGVIFHVSIEITRERRAVQLADGRVLPRVRRAGSARAPLRVRARQSRAPSGSRASWRSVDWCARFERHATSSAAERDVATAPRST